jgi:hypothetical protein
LVLEIKNSYGKFTISISQWIGLRKNLQENPICISFSKRKPMDFRSFFSAIAAMASPAGGEAHLRLTDQHCKLVAGLPTRNSDTLND